MRQSRLPARIGKDVPKQVSSPGARALLKGAFLSESADGTVTALPPGDRVLSRLEAAVATELERRGGCRLRDVSTPRGGTPGFPARAADVLSREVTSARQLPITLYRLGLPTPGAGDESPMSHACEAVLFAAPDGPEAFRPAEVIRAMLSRFGLPQGCDDRTPGRVRIYARTLAGLEDLLSCDRCGYTAAAGAAVSRIEADAPEAERREVREIHGPDLVKVEPLAAFIGIPVRKTTKALLFLADERILAVLVRGDCDVSEARVREAVGCRRLRLADADTVRAATGAEVGYAGPIGLREDVRLLGDRYAVERTNIECGANRTDYHLINVNFGRDLPVPETGDFKLARAGDGCPCCPEGRLEAGWGFLVADSADAGTGVAAAAGFSVPGGDGKPVAPSAVVLRLDVDALLRSLAETCADDAGIAWPPGVAPFDVHLIGLNLNDDAIREEAESLYGALREAGVAVLYDDRDLGAGRKFGESEALGIPIRVTVSRRTAAAGGPEVAKRGVGETANVPAAELPGYLRALLLS